MHLAAVVQLYTVSLRQNAAMGRMGLSRMWKRHMWISLLLKSADRIRRSLDFHQIPSEIHGSHKL